MLSDTPENETVRSADLPFKIDGECFAGAAEDYDTWVQAIHRSNKGSTIDGIKRRAPESEHTDFSQNVNCYFITYSTGSNEIEGIYAYPKSFATGKLPVIIVNRGGNGPNGRWHTARLFHNVLPLARHGFLIIGSQYRGSSLDRGENQRLPDEFGGDDVEDVLALLPIIDAIPYADGERIGMVGWSRGGFMTYLAAARTDRLSAIAVGGTPTDLEYELSLRPEMENVYRARIPNYDDAKVAELRARSAIHWPGRIEQGLPILILHGQSDRRVSLRSALTMADKLQQHQHPFRLIVFENGSHALMEHKPRVRQTLISWFEEKLNIH